MNAGWFLDQYGCRDLHMLCLKFERAQLKSAVVMNLQALV